MHVCVRVCMHVCACVCMHVYVCVCLYVPTPARVCVSVDWVYSVVVPYRKWLSRMMHVDVSLPVSPSFLIHLSLFVLSPGHSFS